MATSRSLLPRPLLGWTFTERLGRVVVLAGLLVGAGSAVAALNWVSTSRGYLRGAEGVPLLAAESALQAQQWALCCLVALLAAVAGLAVLAWDGQRRVEGA